jgi:Spy/CpxP family protein refolding chaperone
MKHVTLFLFIFAAAVLMNPAAVVAQEGPPPEDAMHQGGPENRRPNLLAELGLSPEQVQQVRRMNQERRPAMMVAQRRMRDANRDLDMAIYGDTVSDAEFAKRLGEFQAAQAELARLRFESELSVRKVLTPEQLIRFREIRRRFAEARQQNQRQRRMNRRGGGGLRPGPDGQPKRPIN